MECSTCTYLMSSVLPDGNDWNVCCRYPPVPIVVSGKLISVYPEVPVNSICGEYEEIETDEDYNVPTFNNN